MVVTQGRIGPPKHGPGTSKDQDLESNAEGRSMPSHSLAKEIDSSFVIIRDQDESERTGDRLFFYHFAPEKILHLKVKTHKTVINMLREGLPFAAVDALARELELSRKELASLLSIPMTTFGRRKDKGRLDPSESDRAWRIARIKAKALEMTCGDNAEAMRWLNTSKEILGGETPLQHADTEMGAQEVVDLIGRTMHGVFS